MNLESEYSNCPLCSKVAGLRKATDGWRYRCEVCTGFEASRLADKSLRGLPLENKKALCTKARNVPEGKILSIRLSSDKERKINSDTFVYAEPDV